MSKTKTERLNQLFANWRKRYGAEADRMCFDGIVCEEVYENTDPKLLFIAKEPNSQEEKGFDFREWWNGEVKYAFAKRLCEWTHGIRNGFPPLAEFVRDEKKQLAAIRSISFMNLKKTGGLGSVDWRKLQSITERDKDFLRKQIEIIDPEVVVGGIGDSSLWSVLFPNITLQDCGFDIRVASVGCMKVIDFYHPSYRIPRAMSYSLLGRVFQSEKFKTL